MTTLTTVKPCAFYLQGKCTFGDTCRFPHASPVTSTIPARGPFLRSTPKVVTAQQCKYFMRGSCGKGAKCPFSHNGIASAVTNMKPSTASNIPCKFFKLQKCQNGSKCSFSHALEDEPRRSPFQEKAVGEKTGISIRPEIPLPESLTSPKPQVIICRSEHLFERDINGSKVVFGPGPVVHSIETVFETRTVILTNLSPRTSREDILQYIKPAQDCTHLNIDASVIPVTARLEFRTAAQAVTASQYLNGTKVLGSPVSARLDNARVVTDSGSFRSTKVKVSWYKPSRIAWAHYDDLARAKKEAIRLQGKTFDGQTLSVEFQKPTPQQYCSFSIVIKGLPLNFKEENLEKFCHAREVTIGKQSFHARNSYEQVKALLGRYGTLESFDISSQSNKSPKFKVFAHYREWEDAENACTELHKRPQPFLRHSVLLLENVHAIRYDVTQTRYQAVKRELLNLQKRQPIGCKLRIYDEDATVKVCIRGYSASAKAIASLKIALDALVRGQIVKQDDGSILWEASFVESSTQESSLELAKRYKCWIEFDVSQRRVLLFGSPSNCKSVRTIMLKSSVELKKQVHTISLDTQKLRALITGGLRLVEQIVGEDKVRLDLRHRKLTIEGSATTLFNVENTLKSLDRPYLQSGPACPVCLGEPVNPVTLPCGHPYCMECITRHLKDQSKSRYPDCSCFFAEGTTSCKEPIEANILRRFLTPEEEGSLYSAVYLGYIRSHPKEFMNCPTPDCPTIYRRTAGILRCPSCVVKICSSCNVEYHDGVTCAEYEEELDRELAAMESWKKELDVHSCPNCQANLQKQAGCNHVLCIQCNQHICWVCKEGFADSGSCYKHMGVAHGGIGGEYQGRINGSRK